VSRFPLRLRLTIWYFISLTLILGVFVGFSWFAMKRSMYAAIDQDLRYRITAIESFVATQPMGREGSLAFPNATNSSLGATIIQVTNDKQEILYESAPLDGSLQYETLGSSGWPVRVVSRRSIVHGTVMTIHVAEPLRTLLTSLRRYSIALALALPFILAVGTAAGYWISARALAPVEQLRMDAEAIGVADLSARVSMPSRQDELGRLATTLNAMLAR
jgi:methyl-accepting chemotaxis protein